MVEASALRVKDLGFDSRLCCGKFPGLSHTSDLKIGTPGHSPALGHECQDLLSQLHWNACVQKVDLVYTFIQKSLREWCQNQ